MNDEYSIVGELEKVTAQRDKLKKRVSFLLRAVEDGNLSDGFHTHNELYEYRLLYHAATTMVWTCAGYPVVKSRRYSDGEICFDGEWFIVSCELPTGQITNHYDMKYWGLFAVPEVDIAPVWDEHTPADAAKRLRQWVAALAIARTEYANDPDVEENQFTCSHQHKH